MSDCAGYQAAKAFLPYVRPLEAQLFLEYVSTPEGDVPADGHMPKQPLQKAPLLDICVCVRLCRGYLRFVNQSLS